MKKALLTLTALTFISSVALASPVVDLQKGQSVVGYSYWNTGVKIGSYDLGKTDSNGFYAETAINGNAILGIETINGSKNAILYGKRNSLDTKFTDISFKTKFDKNFQLIIGNRNYDSSVSSSGYSGSENTNRIFYGAGATVDLSKKASAYTSIIHSNVADDWQVGVKYSMSKEAALNASYRSYSEDNFSVQGVEAGISYKF